MMPKLFYFAMCSQIWVSTLVGLWPNRLPHKLEMKNTDTHRHPQRRTMFFSEHSQLTSMKPGAILVDNLISDLLSLQPP
jgi:hypothetical protein